MWLALLLRVQRRIGEENISLIAAGLALYGLLSVFPGLGAAVSLFGIFASPEHVGQLVASLGGVLPAPALEIFSSQLEAQVEKRTSLLGAGAVAGVILALWSARRGVAALMIAIDVTYLEKEERGLIRQLLLSMLYTVLAVAGFLVFLLLAVAVPLIVEALRLGPLAESITLVARWVLLWLLLVLALNAIYRVAPDRRPARWKWTNLGALLGASLWVLGSVGFSLYVRNFGSYGETYGALGGVVVLLLWFLLSAFTVLLGGLLNAEVEHQTAVDSTTGRAKPMGQRGAVVADTLAGEGGPRGED